MKSRFPRRATQALVAASVAALALAGCSTGGGSGSSDGKVTLTLLSHYGSEPMKSGLTKLVDEWNTSHPKIQVKQQVVKFDNLLRTLNVRQTGGRGADIMSSYALWGGQLAKNHVLAKPPADVASEIKKDYSSAAVAAVTGEDGTIFGYPTEFNTYVLFYNKKILADAGFDKPPATWDELKTIAEKTTKKDSNGNYQVLGFSPIQDGDNHLAHPFLSLLDAAGGKFLNAKGKSAMGDKAKKVMQLESEIAEAGASSTTIMPTKTFPTGHVAMNIQASWWIGTLKSQMKDKYKNVGTAPVPGPKAGEKGSLAYAFFMGVNSGSKHKTEAWKFLTWLNSHKDSDSVTAMGAWLESNGLIPPRKSDAETLGEKAIAKDPNEKPIYAAADYAMAESNVANSYEAKTALNKSLEQLLVNHKNVDDVYKKLVQEIDSE